MGSLQSGGVRSACPRGSSSRARSSTPSGRRSRPSRPSAAPPPRTLRDRGAGEAQSSDRATHTERDKNRVRPGPQGSLAGSASFPSCKHICLCTPALLSPLEGGAVQHCSRPSTHRSVQGPVLAPALCPSCTGGDSSPASSAAEAQPRRWQCSDTAVQLGQLPKHSRCSSRTETISAQKLMGFTEPQVGVEVSYSRPVCSS